MLQGVRNIDLRWNRLLVMLFTVMLGYHMVPAEKKDMIWTAKNKPHIIMIVADDLGFNDVPWHNDQVIAPTLKELADEGIILKQSYVLPICSPTRSAILSGLYPFTIGRQDSVIWPLQPTGLSLGLSLIPQYLKPLGYETHAVGKWHLGFCKWAYTPTKRGFDTFRGFYTGSEDYYTHTRTYYGSPTTQHDYNKMSESENVFGIFDKEEHTYFDGESGQYTGYDFRDNETVYYEAKEKYSAFEFSSRVENILHSSSAATPKFVYMAFQNVHSPLQVPKKFIKPYMHIQNKYRRTYLGMVTALDEAVRRIVKSLKETNHYDNCVIVFTTDNGGPTITGGNNWPLRGNKTTLWEGGTRGAAFVHSPLLPTTNKAFDNLVHATDWLSTFVTIAGGDPPKGTDGVSQWEALLGQSKPPRKELIYDFVVKNSSLNAGIRVGHYKLLVGNPGPGEWTPPPEVQRTEEIPALQNFIKLSFANESSTWEFSEHIKFMKVMKRECKSLSCLRSVLKAYRKLKPIPAKTSSKMISIIKKHISIKKKRLNRRNKSLSMSNQRLLRYIHRINKEFGLIESALNSESSWRLYNLRKDPEERHNLASRKPNLVLTLLRRILNNKGRYVPPDTPPDDPCGNPSLWNEVWSPGWC